MRRLLFVAACALAFLALGSTVAARPVATLGIATDSPAVGFGEIEPNVVSLGGDPTSVVTNVRWRTWGGPRAIGSGKGWFLPPNAPDVAHGHYAKARLIAWDRGYCERTMGLPEGRVVLPRVQPWRPLTAQDLPRREVRDQGL
jgi:hypothetical protein